jgi:hypothetical protein
VGAPPLSGSPTSVRPEVSELTEILAAGLSSKAHQVARVRLSCDHAEFRIDLAVVCRTAPTSRRLLRLKIFEAEHLASGVRVGHTPLP